MITISEGEPRDIAAIMPVMQAAFDPLYGEAWTAAQCLSLLAMPGSCLYLAHSEGTLAGFAMTRWIADEEELLLIAVAPEARRKGIASRLLQHIIKSARRCRREIMFIEVRENNPAIAFYTQFGFEQVGRRPSYYSGSDGDRFDALTMKLQI